MTMLGPAVRIEYDAAKLRERGVALSVEIRDELLALGPAGRARYERVNRSIERLYVIAAELEQIASELGAGERSIDEGRLEVDQATSFGTRDGADR